MLGLDDLPTIRHAVLKRLGAEPGVRICDIQAQTYAAGDGYWADPPACKVWARATVPFIRVALLSALGDSIVHDARFDLPVPFEIGHLHNEIDEIAESMKIARRDLFTAALRQSERKLLKGTGTRGNWSRYADHSATKEVANDNGPAKPVLPA